MRKGHVRIYPLFVFWRKCEVSVKGFTFWGWTGDPRWMQLFFVGGRGVWCISIIRPSALHPLLHVCTLYWVTKQTSFLSAPNTKYLGIIKAYKTSVVSVNRNWKMIIKMANWTRNRLSNDASSIHYLQPLVLSGSGGRGSKSQLTLEEIMMLPTHVNCVNACVKSSIIP